MKNQCVVSFADTPFYLNKMNRLENSLKGNFDGDFISFTDVKQVGAPPHKEVPYAFKPYSIQKAIDMGYELILYCDSPIVAIKNIQPVFDHIEEHGYLFFNNIGHELGKWSHDKALKYFGKTREEAMNIKQTMQCCFGLNMRSQVAKDFFSEYIGVAYELYPGSWENSRHDQMTASFIINKMGLDILNGHESFFIYTHFKQVFTISQSVCLESQ